MNHQLGVAMLARRVCSLAGLLLLGTAQLSAAYQPQLDQPGKDVVWVPTPDALVNTMLDLAKVRPDDYVIDLGSGDGRLVIAAARRGARAHGIEYDDKLVAHARRQAQQAGVGDKASFAQADLFAGDFSKASVVTLFLGPELNRKLLPKLLALKPGTRIVSNTHPIGDWPADEKSQTADAETAVYYRTALLWIVPAKVAGVWQSAQGPLRLTQRYQKIDGTLERDGKTVAISHAKLRGAQLTFSAGSARYTGVAKGNVIDGTQRRGGAIQSWRLLRVKSS